jgi:hypothetical protein
VRSFFSSISHPRSNSGHNRPGPTAAVSRSGALPNEGLLNEPPRSPFLADCCAGLCSNERLKTLSAYGRFLLFKSERSIVEPRLVGSCGSALQECASLTKPPELRCGRLSTLPASMLLTAALGARAQTVPRAEVSPQLGDSLTRAILAASAESQSFLMKRVHDRWSAPDYESLFTWSGSCILPRTRADGVSLVRLPHSLSSRPHQW